MVNGDAVPFAGSKRTVIAKLCSSVGSDSDMYVSGNNPAGAYAYCSRREIL